MSNKTVDTVIGQGTRFEGKLSSSGSVRIEGQFDGEIETSSDLIIGKTGRVKATVKCKNASIAGNLIGDLLVEERLEIVPSGSLQGNAKMKILVVENGARFDGRCEMVLESGRSISKVVGEEKTGAN